MIRRLLCVGPTFFYSSRSATWWRGRGNDILWISARKYVGIWKTRQPQKHEGADILWAD